MGLSGSGDASQGGHAAREPADAGLLALTAAAFLVSVDRAVFAPLLPAIAHDLHSTIAATGLAVTAYTIPYGACQLFYGPVADRAGKIAVVRWAVVVFALGTALCGLVPALPVLHLLRAVTGGAAAAVIPLSLAYIGDVVPYGRRQQTIATLMGITALGTAMSTAIGGVVGNFLSWRALFGFSGACALVVIVALFRLPAAQPASAVALVSPAAALPAAGRRDWGWHRYSRVLQLGRARALFVLVALEGAALYGGLTYLGAYLQARFGLDYLAIGALLAVNGASTLLSSRLLHRLHGRFAERHLLLAGGLLIAAGFLSLAPLTDWRLFPLSMAAMGGGFSFFHSTLQVRATELQPELRGTSVALFAFSLFIGTGIGTALLGWLAVTHGYVPMVLASGITLLLVTLAAWKAP